MTPEEQRRRAGGAVAQRMKELGFTVPQLAEKAGVDQTTVRALLAGRRRLRDTTWEAVLGAVDLPRGEVGRQMWALSQLPTTMLVRELCHRFGGHETPDSGTSRPKV